MPELPEVETVRTQLARTWEGRRITRVQASRPNYFFVSSPALLRAKLVGKRMLRLERHGKYLIAHFDDHSRLLLHLGMTGQFVSGSLPRDPHVHLILHLSGNHQITLRDVRKFGKVEWIAPGKSSARLDKLGPDALTADSDELKLQLRKRNVAIKTAILDQKVWAGVGNIYADEALYASAIHPQTPAKRLSSKRVERLCHEVQDVLQRAIKAGGSTINDYLQPDGELGGFQDWHHVYGKTGQPCPQCGRAISRIVLGGRSTHFCARCQR